MFRRRKDCLVSNHLCRCPKVCGVLFPGIELLLMYRRRRPPMPDNLVSNSTSYRCTMTVNRKKFFLAKISKPFLFAFLMTLATPLWATWGIVQQVVGPQVQATSVTTQIPTQITTGDLIVVHVVWANNSAATVTDTLGNTYVSAGVSQGS